MAAIDKIYLNYEEYLQFKDWCERQPRLTDKYGQTCTLSYFLYNYKEPFKGTRPAFMAPCYVDAYIIRNCPLKAVQKELMLNYGYWSEERIKELYDWIKEGHQTWATEKDFIIHEDGSITMSINDTCAYTQIKNNLIYTKPSENNYIPGKHFKISYRYNKPYKCKKYWVEVQDPSLWYHEDTDTWDDSSDFVFSKWTSNTAFCCKTVKALKRKLRKWKLPIGTVVVVSGRYNIDNFKIVIKK